MSIKKKALKGFSWTFFQLFSNQLFSFFVSIILARLLLPEEFGLIGMLTIFIALSETLINSGLSYSLIRSENLDDEDYSTVFFFNLLVSLIIYIIIFFLAPYIASFYNQEILTMLIRVYSITFIINAFSTVQTTRLTKIMDFKTQMKVSIPSLVIGSSIGIYMAYNGFGVWSLVWNIIIQSLLSSIQLWYWTNWKPTFVFNIEKFKYHFNFGFKLMLSSVLDVIFKNSYAIIIGKYYSASDVGYYNRADSFQMLPAKSLGSVLSKVTYPLFSTIQNDVVKLKSVYKKIMQMAIFLIAPTITFMIVLAEPLFRFVLTEKWLPAVPYFQILCITGLLYPLHVYNLQILNIMGRSDLFLKLEILKKIIFAIIILISFNFGIYGLLYGSVINSIICFFINTHYSGKFLNYSSWEQTQGLLPILMISLFTGGVIHFFDKILLNHLFFDSSRLFLGSLVGAVLFLILGRLFKISSLQDLINIIKRK
jgi:teichuronic acid exporter